MTSTSRNPPSILFSSPSSQEESSIKGEQEKERNSLASTEEMSENDRSGGTWEKRKTAKSRRICLWILLGFVAYVITLVFIFGITYASIKMSEKSSLSKMEGMMTERGHPFQTKQKVDLAPLPLLWTLPFEKFQEIATIILQVSEVDRRMYRVSAAFRNYETNVTTMKFMTGEELAVSSEMGMLSDSTGVPIVYWDFKALGQPNIDDYFEGNLTYSFPETYPPSVTSYLNSTLVDDNVDISSIDSSSATVEGNSTNRESLFPLEIDLPVYPLLRGTFEPNNSSVLIENVFPTPFLSEVSEEEGESSSRLVEESGEEESGEVEKIQDGDMILTGFPMPMIEEDVYPRVESSQPLVDGMSSRRLGSEYLQDVFNLKTDRH